MHVRVEELFHYPLVRILLIVGCAILLGYSATQSYLLLAFFAVAAGVVAFWVTWRFPLVAIIAMFLTGGISNILVFTPAMIEAGNTFVVGGGVTAVDLVFVLMLGMVVVRLASESARGGTTLPRMLFPAIALMGFWFAVAVIRNLETFGLSAVGEFRFRYLLLIVPIFIGCFFPSRHSRFWAFKIIILGTVFLPLLLLPFVIQQLGWSSSYTYRLLPPDVSLGIVYGLIALILAKKYNYLNIWSWLIWGILICVGFILVIDSPRSTWLATIIVLVILLTLGEIDVNSGFYMSLLVLAAVPVIIGLSSVVGIDPVSIISDRAVALYAPTEDANATWRIELWQAYIQHTLDSGTQLIGEGFGGYWNMELGFGREITVFPHNLFVMTFVKLGVIGVGIYLVVVLVLASHFIRFLRRQDSRQNPEYALVLTAFFVLVASQAYYMAFGLDYYTWLFVGLGIAVIAERETYAPLYCDPGS